MLVVTVESVYGVAKQEDELHLGSYGVHPVYERQATISLGTLVDDDPVMALAVVSQASIVVHEAAVDAQTRDLWTLVKPTPQSSRSFDKWGQVSIGVVFSYSWDR